MLPPRQTWAPITSPLPSELDSILGLFFGVAAELVKDTSEEANEGPNADKHEAEELDMHTLSTTTPAPLPMPNTPIPHSEALILQNLFNYPPMIRGVVTDGNLLTKF